MRIGHAGVVPLNAFARTAAPSRSKNSACHTSGPVYCARGPSSPHGYIDCTKRSGRRRTPRVRQRGAGSPVTSSLVTVRAFCVAPSKGTPTGKSTSGPCIAKGVASPMTTQKLSGGSASPQTRVMPMLRTPWGVCVAWGRVFLRMTKRGSTGSGVPPSKGTPTRSTASE